MTVADWLTSVTTDSERRGLSELVPLLQTLARSTEALRAADAEFGHPASEWTDNEATQHAEGADDGGH